MQCETLLEQKRKKERKKERKKDSTKQSLEKEQTARNIHTRHNTVGHVCYVSHVRMAARFACIKWVPLLPACMDRATALPKHKRESKAKGKQIKKEENKR